MQYGDDGDDLGSSRTIYSILAQCNVYKSCSQKPVLVVFTDGVLAQPHTHSLLSFMNQNVCMHDDMIMIRM